MVNCFERANINYTNQRTAVTDAHDPFKSLEEELENLRKLDESAVLSAESFLELDSEFFTSVPCMSDADIFAEVVRPRFY